jgi:hypothetical protein
MATTRTEPGSAWAGWIIFAAAMLVVIGALNILEGIVALVDDRRLVITADRLIAVDLTGWGWTILIFGAVLIATGIGLFTMRTWARITAIVVVSLHAISQIGWLGAFPIWSLLMIALDTTVLFALTARWSVARYQMDPYGMRDETGQHAAVG